MATQAESINLCCDIGPDGTWTTLSSGRVCLDIVAVNVFIRCFVRGEVEHRCRDQRASIQA
ncbi:MAG: hypothetical protein VX589_12655 [Myxococcota bacterium]|nr:hypothetical protein [Myxococcota bacterium]